MMKRMQHLLNEPMAKIAANLMKYICYIVILFLLFSLVLSFMGRQTFILRMGTETYDSAMYAVQNDDRTGLKVGSKDVIRVNANKKIDVMTQVGLSAMFAVDVIPLIISFWFLGKVFSNISQGRIFIRQNANYLLYYGLIRIVLAVIVPYIKLLLSFLANLFSSSQISLSTGQHVLNELVPNIAFIVAAYIIHYGIQLQDEVDHTL